MSISESYSFLSEFQFNNIVFVFQQLLPLLDTLNHLGINQSNEDVAACLGNVINSIKRAD